MKLLDEIKQQPLHIRKLFMWTSVVITFSLVGFVWMNNAKNNVVALLNGTPSPASRIEQNQPASPFAAIGKIFKRNPTPTPQPSNTIPPQRLP